MLLGIIFTEVLLKTSDAIDYYFITKYFDDGESWCGHSKSPVNIK